MNVIESDLLYTARSGSEFTDPGSGSGLVWPVQAAPETRECCQRNDNNNHNPRSTQQCLQNYDIHSTVQHFFDSTNLNSFDCTDVLKITTLINYRCQLNQLIL